MGKLVIHYCDLCETKVEYTEDLVKTIICYRNDSSILGITTTDYVTHEVCLDCKEKLDLYYSEATKQLIEDLKSTNGVRKSE